MNLKKSVKIILIFILLGIFFFFIYNIINYLNNSSKNKKINDDLINVAIKEIPQSTKTKDNDIKTKAPIEVDFNKLKEINSNIAAWIYMENSIINYPVIKGNDNIFYLNHSIDGKYNPTGTLFIDYRNNENFDDVVTYIYGHHMKNNTMFGNLEFFKEQSYYNEHKEMYLFTNLKEYKVDVFAGFTTDDGSIVYNYIDCNSNQEIVDFAKNNSDFETNVEIADKDKIVVLSTCSYDYENARYVVFGILREI